jgi:hypothetical protein
MATDDALKPLETRLQHAAKLIQYWLARPSDEMIASAEAHGCRKEFLFLLADTINLIDDDAYYQELAWELGADSSELEQFT